MKRNPWKWATIVLSAGLLALGGANYGTLLHAVVADGKEEAVVPSELVLNPTTPATGQAVVQEMEVPKDQTVPPDMKADPKDVVPPPLTAPKINGKYRDAKKTAKLVVHVIDGRTGKPIEGAETVLLETAERFKSDATGNTPSIDAPVIREEQYADQVAALHGQLGLVTYKNGYRDSITLGVRMHEGRQTDVTVWMYQLEPGDRRIEPVFYHEPYHHLWLVRLADAFRSPTQPGEGQESPTLEPPQTKQ